MVKIRQAEYDINEARDVYIARMELEGNTVVYPADNELQLDLDDDYDYERFIEACEVMERNKIPFKVTSVEPSRSGLPSRHAIIQFPDPVTPWQRIAWQGAFGSDHIRELLSCIRLQRGDIHPTLLVEGPPT